MEELFKLFLSCRLLPTKNYSEENPLVKTVTFLLQFLPLNKSVKKVNWKVENKMEVENCKLHFLSLD